MTRRPVLIALMALSAATLHADLPFDFTITPANLDGTVYRERVSHFSLSSPDGGFTLPLTGTQAVLKCLREKGKTVIVIRTGLSREETLAERDAAASLEDTRFLTLDSPGIRAVSSRLRGAADPIEAVEQFVHGHIAEKKPGIPLIPAKEVLRIRRGDCTEHSVLAAALLRSLAVPARALVGVYLAEEFMGKKDVFVYHMWVEAYRDGRWRIVDATRPGGRATNRYIAFALHNLKTETPLPYLRAIGAVQGLSIRYCGRRVECD